MEARKVKEKEFHDKIRFVTDDAHVADTRWSPEMEDTIKVNPLWTNMKYYAVERESRSFVLDWFKKNTKGKVVLDYCCGNGDDGVRIAKGGAQKVYGIDISDVSIDNCKKLAKKEGVVAKDIEHIIGDAENTGFKDSMFDVVTEYGALHHLDLDKAYAEIARVLKPDGKAICQEALAHNLIIHLYRRLTPSMRTEWEVDHILRKKQIMMAYKYFNKVDVKLYHLAVLFAVPFRKTKFFGPLLTCMEWVDKLLLKVPVLRWQAWQAVIILSEPKK